MRVWEMSDSHTPARVDIGLVSVLDDPARVCKLPVNILPGFLFRTKCL